MLTANTVCCSRPHLCVRCLKWLLSSASCCFSTYTGGETSFPFVSPVAHCVFLPFTHSCFPSWPTQTSYYHTLTPPTFPPTATTTFSPCLRTTSPSLLPPAKPSCIHGSRNVHDCPSTDTLLTLHVASYALARTHVGGLADDVLHRGVAKGGTCLGTPGEKAVPLISSTHFIFSLCKVFMHQFLHLTPNTQFTAVALK